MLLEGRIKYLGNYIKNSGTSVKLPVNELERLHYVCTHEIKLQFNECIYRKNGVAKGSL